MSAAPATFRPRLHYHDGDMPDAPVPLEPFTIRTPCIGVCRLDADGLCEGCLRSGEEIARWRAMSDAERLHCMTQVLPVRRRPA